MGIRGELFTTQIPVENRTYFFNVKENRLGDVFLQIVESKNTDGAGFDRHAIVVFQDEMQTFLQGLNQSLEFIEKKRKEQLKEKREKKQRSAEAEDSSVPDDFLDFFTYLCTMSTGGIRETEAYKVKNNQKIDNIISY